MNTDRENEKKKTIVSIVMPVYNSARFLLDALESISNQTFKFYEIIAVDDGSTDESDELLEQYASEHDEVTVIHVPNGGPSKARNIGLSYAKGEWIQFMDADDFIERDMLEQMYQNSKQVDLVVSGACRDDFVLGSHDKITVKSASVTNSDEIASYLSVMDQDNKDLLLNYLWNKWFRKSVIIENNITFDETLRLGEDFVFNCTFLKSIHAFTVLNKAYYHYCIRANESLAHSFQWNEADRRALMYRVFIDLLSSYNIKDKMEEMVRCNEGKYCWVGICKVMLETCDLDRESKIEYIEKFFSVENRRNMICYFKTRKGLSVQLRKLAVRQNHPGMLYLLLCVNQNCKKFGASFRRSNI